MNLRSGELLMLGFHGTRLPDWLVDFEGRFGLGGVILFDRDLERKGELRNIESPEQVRALCAEIHALPSRPLVFIDQEGGRVTRLKPERGFAALPSAAAIARLDETKARDLITASFAEMAALGIDFDLAPVVDLDSNPDNPNIGALERAFSADPNEVRRCVELYADAAERVGLGLCLKHFPGLGGATTDSHSAITDITGTLSADQLALFRDLTSRIPGSAVLLSHGIVRDWDPDWPVSISEAGVARLRADHPEALLISDDVQMQGLQAFCSTREGTLRGVRAGLDLVCIGNNLRSEAGDCEAVASDLIAQAIEDPDFESRIREAIETVASRKRAARPA